MKTIALVLLTFLCVGEFTLINIQSSTIEKYTKLTTVNEGTIKIQEKNFRTMVLVSEAYKQLWEKCK